MIKNDNWSKPGAILARLNLPLSSLRRIRAKSHATKSSLRAIKYHYPLSITFLKILKIAIYRRKFLYVFRRNRDFFYQNIDRINCIKIKKSNKKLNFLLTLKLQR